jgi:hypothetical protein
MPRDLDDVQTGNRLLFAEDLKAQPELKLISISVFDASEVRDREDTPWPEFGDWLHVSDGYDEKYCVAHAGLIEALQEAEIEPGDTFEIVRFDRPGDEDHSPYEVEISTESD